jgi:hypothetical protein
VVERRRQLDDVHSGQRENHADPADGVEELARAQSAGLGCPGGRGRPGVDHVHVDREEHRVTVFGGGGDRLGQTGVEAAGDELGHLAAAHALVRHPRQRVGIGPVARRPIWNNRSPRTAPDSISRRIGVPWPTRDPNWRSAVSAWASKWRTETRPQPTWRATPVTSGRGDGVVPSEDHRDRARRGDAVDGLLQPGQRVGGVARRHLDIADVDHGQIDQGSTPRARWGRRPSSDR